MGKEREEWFSVKNCDRDVNSGHGLHGERRVGLSPKQDRPRGFSFF